MKKLAIAIMILSFVACGQESSPEGRSKMRDENIQLEMEQLKEQNKALMDSISLINKELKQLRVEMTDK